MTGCLAIKSAHRSLFRGHSRIPIRSGFQVQLAFPFSFRTAYSPLCSGSGLVFRSNLRPISPINASMNSGMLNSTLTDALPKELRDVSDFEAPMVTEALPKELRDEFDFEAPMVTEALPKELRDESDFEAPMVTEALPKELRDEFDFEAPMVTEALPKELRDESDFEALFPDSDYISVCGFGSLLSVRSARSTFPELINFRVARLNGFRRVFGNVAPIFFERGIAKPETKEISSLCSEPCEGENIIITVFEIKKSEIPAFMEREIEFRFLAVLPETLDGELYDKPAVLCSRFTDEEFFQVRCKGNKDILYQNYGRFDVHKIWRDDVLPCRVYLRHCVLAAKSLGDTAYNNFLDHTFLGDRITTAREYLATNGAGILEEVPPESLKDRYGG